MCFSIMIWLPSIRAINSSFTLKGNWLSFTKSLGKFILCREEKDGQIKRIDDYTYKVKSQTKDVFYNVVSTTIGWKCTCPDHTSRGVKCKHIYVVEVSFNLREQVKKSVVIQPIVISDCIFCHSTHLKKNGIRHNTSGDI